MRYGKFILTFLVIILTTAKIFGESNSQPIGEPTNQPTSIPSTQPNAAPSSRPTVVSSKQPSSQPTALPTWPRTRTPTRPTGFPTAYPTLTRHAPIVTNMEIKSSSNLLSLTVTFTSAASYPGHVYCAAFDPSTIITSVGQIVANAISVAFANAYTAVAMQITELHALTEYSVYCYVETMQGFGNSLAEVLLTRTNRFTLCCKAIAYTNALSYVFGNVSMYENTEDINRFVFRYSLSAPPSDELIVEPSINTTSGQLMSRNILALLPQAQLFTASSSLLEGIFIISLNASATFTSGEFIVWLRLSGSSSTEYYPLSTISTIMTSNQVPRPPRMVSAMFTRSGAAMHINFDSPVNLTVKDFSGHNCSFTFHFPGSERAICTWIKATQALVVFPAFDSALSFAKPFDTVLLRTGVLRAQCSGRMDCSQFTSNVAQSMIITAPLHPVLPKVDVIVPRYSAPCTNVTIDASTSSGHGGRFWNVGNWSVRTNVAEVNTQPLLALLHNLGRTYKQFISFAASDYTVYGVEYVMTMTVQSFLGTSASGFAMFTVLDNPNIPVVTIVGSTQFVLSPADALSVNAVIIKSDCAESGLVFTIIWRVYTMAGEEVEVASRSLDPSWLILPPWTLDPGGRYRVEVTASVPATDHFASVQGTASAYVAIQMGRVVAIISGGDHQLLIPEDIIILDASGSYDENTGTTEGFSYLWSCTLVSPQRFGESCNEVFVVETLTRQRASVLGFSLLLMESYSFRVVISATNGRVGTTAVTVRAQDPGSSTSVRFTSFAMKINANDRLLLTADISAGYAITGTWTATIGAAQFPFSALTPTTATFNANQVATGIQYALHVAGQIFSPGTTVTFRLTVDRSDAPGSIYQSFHEVNVAINSAPTSGSVEVFPGTGMELITLYRLSAEGWTDDPEDYPLSYGFSYTRDLESTPLAIRTRKLINSVTTHLPGGSSFLNHSFTLTAYIFDLLLAATHAETFVTVLQSVDDADTLYENYKHSALDAFSASSDSGGAIRDVNYLTTILNLVNCSKTGATFCASRNRRPCSAIANTCSACLVGYVGVIGPSNSKCLSTTTNRRLSENTSIVGELCSTNDDCVLGSCAEGRCRVPEKLCPSSILGSACSGNGRCVYYDNTGKELSKTCTAFDTHCIATCACKEGWGGVDCSKTFEELLLLSNSRGQLCAVLHDAIALSNLSPQIVDVLVASLNAIFDPVEVVTVTDYFACAQVMNITATRVLDGLLVGAAAHTTANLLTLAGKFVSSNVTGVAFSQEEFAQLVNSLVGEIARGITSSMVTGQEATTVATPFIRFTGSRALSSSEISINSPLSEEEESYGISFAIGVEVVEGAGVHCDDGHGYVNLCLIEWGSNPFQNATNLEAPQIKLVSQVVPAEATLLSRNVLEDRQKVLDSSLSPSYYITLQFNSPQDFPSNALVPNATFPECIAYSDAQNQYGTCNGCELSSYTSTNVTIACYDIALLCDATATDGNAVTQITHMHMPHRYLQEDYTDDSAGFGEQTSVTSIQYSALVATASTVLSTNPFATDFKSARIVLSVVLGLCAIIVLGFMYFRSWDVRDHNEFLYKHKEPPHLRVKKKETSALTRAFQRGKLFKSVSIASNSIKPVPTQPPKTVSELESISSSRSGTEDEELERQLDMLFTNNPSFAASNRNKRGGTAAMQNLGRLCSLRFGSYYEDYERFADDEADFNETEFFESLISNYIRTVLPIKNLDGKPVPTSSAIATMLSRHPIFMLFFRPSLQVTRVQRWMLFCLFVMTSMFVDTLFFSTFFPDAGECESYETEMNCLNPQNNALGTNLCSWTADESLQEGGECSATSPPSDMTFVMVLVMLTLIICVPITFAFDFVMETYCSKRPNFNKWGYNTEAILGRCTQSLGKFDEEKLLAPIVALRNEVRRAREAEDARSHFHSTQYIEATEIKQSSSERELDDINEGARGVYDEFNSVSAEVDQILDDVTTYLTVTLRTQTLPWHSEASCTSRHTASASIEKVRAIEEHLGVYSDGTPVPLTILEYLRYGSAREKLEATIANARKLEGDILETLDGLGENELLSKDEALTQFFVLEQFSVFKQYALRSMLFDFAVTSALPVHPLKWILSWTLIVCFLLFFLYWTLAWGLRTTGVAMEAWAMNFGVALGQDLVLVQMTRLYVIYMISTITIKPQLTAIYSTLQRLAIEYVQDELPDTFGTIKVVQHVSPACRVAKLKISDNLASGQILRHVDDRDISNVRIAGDLKLPILLLTIVSIPVIVGVLSESAGDVVLETALPSAYSMFILAHYFAWQVSPLLVIIFYVALVLLSVFRYSVFQSAERVLKHMRKTARCKAETRSLAGWHLRSGLGFPANERCFTSMQRYGQTTLSRCWTGIIEAAAAVVYYSCHIAELPVFMHSLLFPSSCKEALYQKQWKFMNLPRALQCQTFSSYSGEKEGAHGATRTPAALELPAVVKQMARDVYAVWNRASSHEESQIHQPADCTAFLAQGYLQAVAGNGALHMVYPAKMSDRFLRARVGKHLTRGWRTPFCFTASTSAVRQFRIRHGYCRSSKRALAHVMASYREQVLEGSIFFISLLDEEEVASATSPWGLLNYSGLVHVRDMALMLEEVLFYYRPCALLLSEECIDYVLSEYDVWVRQHCVPIDQELACAAALLVDGEDPGRGHYQQPKIVAGLRFSERAIRLKARSQLMVVVTEAQNSEQGILAPQESVCWSDIRLALDKEFADRLYIEDVQLEPFKVSVAARAVRRRQHRKPQLTLRIADAAVNFRTFARWLHHLFKELADTEEQQTLMMTSRLHSASTEETLFL